MPGATGRATRPATIEDVAKAAGVSRAAVSKVIRSAYGVSPAMKDKVTRAIAQLNYRPSLAARAMRGSTFTIGFEIPGLTNDFLFRILAGAAEALHGTNYQLIVAPATADAAEGYRAIGSLADRQVDGIVAISPLVTSEWLETLASRVPLVMIGRHDTPVNYDSVVGDDITGAGLVMEHLLALGHTRIAHLTLPEKITSFAVPGPHARRLESYIAAMRSSGHFQPDLIWRSGSSMQESEVAALEFLTRPNRPTALFAGNDEMALGVMHAAGKLGLASHDLAIVGYDNIEVARLPGVSLSSIDQSGLEMGHDAVALLMERISGRTESRTIVKSPKLRVRQSSSSPRAPLGRE